MFMFKFRFVYGVQDGVRRRKHEVRAMTVQREGRAPYASTGSIKTVIEKHRQVGLQDVSLERLQRIGITEALAPRTLYALTFLGFYDEGGHVTPEFDAVRKVPEHDFKPALADLLKQAYAPILENLDPAVATQLDVENAFRGFEPTGQLPRMVQLFMGLMAYVGLMPEPKRRAGAVSQAAKSPKPKTAERGQAGRGGQTGHLDDDPGHEHQPETPGAGGSSVMEQAFKKRLENVGGERRDISLGDAGSVTIIVDVRWLDLPDEQFAALRKLIKDIEALGASGSNHDEQVGVPMRRG
jgi:hypothetical protein